MTKARSTASGEYAKHLRPARKRHFWKKERKAGRREATARE